MLLGVSIPNDPVRSRVYLSFPRRADIREPWVFPLQYFEQLRCLLTKIPPGFVLLRHARASPMLALLLSLQSFTACWSTVTPKEITDLKKSRLINLHFLV